MGKNRKQRSSLPGHAAASLNQDGSTKVRQLDKGLDPAVPVKIKAPANPYQQARTMERKANAPKPRNPYQDARGMEKKAEKMLEPSVAGKIFNGLGEMFDKAPAGIVKALSDTKDALTSEEMKKGAEFGFRAAWEVVKETGRIVGEDVVVNTATSALPIPIGKAVSMLKAGSDALGMQEKTTALEKRIQEIRKNVYR